MLVTRLICNQEPTFHQALSNSPSPVTIELLLLKFISSIILNRYYQLALVPALLGTAPHPLTAKLFGGVVLACPTFFITSQLGGYGDEVKFNTIVLAISITSRLSRQVLTKKNSTIQFDIKADMRQNSTTLQSCLVWLLFNVAK